MSGPLIPLEECRRVLGLAAVGLSDDELARKVAVLELLARRSVEEAERELRAAADLRRTA